MKTYYTFRQNNSGGSFTGPAVNVIVKAKSLDEAIKLTEKYFTLCGDSDLYAEYDSCGCCPCCGHRWRKPWDDDPESAANVLDDVMRMGVNYMGGVGNAIIFPDGSILIGDSEEKRLAIINYLQAS